MCYSASKPHGKAFWLYMLYGKKPTTLNSDKIVPKYLLCGGGTLFCLILGLETSVSCSICGTWEAILSESLSDTITDGSVETASEGASSGYLKKKNRKKKFQEFTKSYNSKTFLYSYFGTILSRRWEDGTEKLSKKKPAKIVFKATRLWLPSSAKTF